SIGVMGIMVVLGILDLHEISEKKVIYILLYSSICVVYISFIVATLFYKPVKDWVAERSSFRKKFDVGVTLVFMVLTGLSWGLFFFLGNMIQRELIIDQVYTNHTWEDKCFSINLNYKAGFNTLTINTDGT